MNIIQWVLIALSIPVLVVMAHLTIKRARALSERIDEYKAAQEAAKNAPGPINPYADFASIMGVEIKSAEEGKEAR